MNKIVYIVLHDFTEVGDAALKYATYLSQNVSCEIKVLHIVADLHDIANAEKKIDQIIAKSDKTSNVSMTSLIRVGSIFEDIGKVVSEEKAQLVIMGTHGMKGFQKIFGSYAMKVVTSSEAPFIVLQKETLPKELKKIIVPIDLSNESLQIINSAGDIAQMFNAKIYLAYEKQNDLHLQRQIKNKIKVVRSKYKQREIVCEMVQLESSGAYNKKIMAYSKENGIDLIAISYHTLSILPQFDKFAQSLITNESNLPCMIINSKESSFSYF
jgi:nucleotide-binding universal stress UspA family protein